MSDSAETPSSSKNDDQSSSTPGTNVPPPAAVSPPPIIPSKDSDGGGDITGDVTAAAPPTDNADSPPPPPSSEPPPSSPPPSSSPPPVASSPPSDPDPPASSEPPPSSKSPPPSLPNHWPPPSSHSSPPPTTTHSPPLSAQSPPAEDETLSQSPPPDGFVAPPSLESEDSPPSPTELFTPSPPNTPPNLSPLIPSPSTGSAPKQSGPVSPPVSDGSPSGSSSVSPVSKNSSESVTKSGTGEDSGRSTSSTKAVTGTVVAGVVLVTIIALFFVVRKRKKRRDYYGGGAHYMPPPTNFTVKTDGFYYGQQPNSMGFSGPTNHSYGSQLLNSPERGNVFNGGAPEISGGKSVFSYDELMEITNGFARQNVIGEGGFGCVYKGYLGDGKAVAVKQLKVGSGQGDREFKAEVEIISRVHHRNLVSLVGYCISSNQRLLIYEFVPNNTLEHHLHTKGLPVLDWSKRLKIAIDSAKGLAYLHEDCHPKIIHRDIKSANILLDDDFEAQVADFGLARLNDSSQTHVSTRVMGTFGYLAPEYASSGKLSDRSDVYSFGVVLLELITGRKPIDTTQPLGDESLVEWARPLLLHALETGDLIDLVDPRLEKLYVESEMMRMIEIAAACVRHSAPKRPRMMQVVRTLDSDGEMSDLSNGVKYGQSTVYDSGQYNEEIMKFRRMALGSDDSSEFNYTTKVVSHGPPTSGEYTSGESETRAINPQAEHGNYSARRYR